MTISIQVVGRTVTMHAPGRNDEVHTYPTEDLAQESMARALEMGMGLVNEGKATAITVRYERDWADGVRAENAVAVAQLQGQGRGR